MQTFLPYPDFVQSADCLDNKRLGKQRVEVMQLLNALDWAQGRIGWRWHPAAKMWAGYASALVDYGKVVCDEWINRGFHDTYLEKIVKMGRTGSFEIRGTYTPPWLGDEDFHLSHKSNLIRKNPNHYRPFFPNVPDNLPYIWPV